MDLPTNPKIYHILHVDKLPSIIQRRGLLCDASISNHNLGGTTIGMNRIKKRRLEELTFKNNYPDLYIGQCVPFYFCPRSIMLYLIHQANHPELSYSGGQKPIIHLQADLHKTILWANKHHLRWAFTSCNAGSAYFEDYNDLSQLHVLDWEAIHSDHWQQHKEKKQAEFLIEKHFSWNLIEHIGVFDETHFQRVAEILKSAKHQPLLNIEPSWYY